MDYLDENVLQRRPNKTDIAVIMYTSGSTGTPKGYFFQISFYRPLDNQKSYDFQDLSEQEIF